MPKILFIADDLTGAAEVASGVAAAGMRSFLYHQPDAIDSAFDGVITIDIGSRHQDAAGAAEGVRAVAEHVKEAIVYKKSDSTLRGNLGAEVGALVRAFPGHPLLYFPAAPPAGRTVSDGRVYVNGVPLEETEFAEDPLAPVRTGDVVRLLREDSGCRVHGVSMVEVRSGKVDLRRPGEIFVFDGETMEDLGAAGRLGLEQGVLKVLGGAGSFAALLPSMIGWKAQRAAQPRLKAPRLILNGSLNPSALCQIEEARNRGLPTFRLLPEAVFGVGARAESERIFDQVRRCLTRGEDVILCTALSREDGAAYLDAASEAHVRGPERYLTEHLANMAADLVRAEPETSLVTFGGELTEATWRSLGAEVADVLGAIVPLVYAMRVQYPDGELLWASKPGGFGKADLLTDLLDIGAP